MEMENPIETTYSRIKNFLLNSDIYPGQKFPHVEICKKMGISFSPLREAFIRLATEGLLIHKNQRGFFVPQISYEEAREFYDARILIEPYLVKEAAKFMTEEKLESIRNIHNSYKRMAAEPYSRNRLLVDKSFHLEILEMGGNQKLTQIVDGIFNSLIVRRTIAHLPPERPHRAYEEHFAILESLARGNGKKASQLMKYHIRMIKKFVLDNLNNRQNDFDSASYWGLSNQA
jgi:DNA-binding GntR family transcriptional regulator